MRIIDKVTRLLLLLCILTGGGIIFIVFSPAPVDGIDMPLTIERSGNGNIDKDQEDPASDQAPFDAYDKVFSERNIFQSVVGFSSEKQRALHGIEKTVQGGAFSPDRYKVMGILIDQDPEVVLQDTDSQEIFFLSVGQSVDGAMVEQILPGKVILNVNGRSIEIRP